MDLSLLYPPPLSTSPEQQLHRYILKSLLIDSDLGPCPQYLDSTATKISLMGYKHWAWKDGVKGPSEGPAPIWFSSAYNSSYRIRRPLLGSTGTECMRCILQAKYTHRKMPIPLIGVSFQSSVFLSCLPYSITGNPSWQGREAWQEYEVTYHCLQTKKAKVNAHFRGGNGCICSLVNAVHTLCA